MIRSRFLAAERITRRFFALVVQRHHRVLTDDEFLHLLKAHVDHGFALIANDTNGFKSEDDYVEYLVELTRAGLEQRTQEAAPTMAATDAFGGLLDLQIGWNAATDAPVSVEFNRRTNNYLAVTGKPGSGKTQFVKDLLAQIRRQSDYKVNFVFFDYAKGDVADDADFVAATRAEVVRLPEESLPLNPFSRVNVNSETAVKVAAQEFADLIRDVEKRLGTVQAQQNFCKTRSAYRRWKQKPCRRKSPICQSPKQSGSLTQEKIKRIGCACDSFGERRKSRFHAEAQWAQREAGENLATDFKDKH